MCKYCEFTYVNDEIGERGNENVHIKEIKDGSHITGLSINRYQDYDDPDHINELIVYRRIEINDHEVYKLSEDHINIAYCPFCGEKL